MRAPLTSERHHTSGTTHVIIGAPLEGKLAYSHAALAEMWRWAAVTLSKTSSK